MARLLEEIFVTEGVPQETFVRPPNYNEILIDVRNKGKPVVIEGQSGTGKTTVIKKILEEIGKELTVEYLSARKPPDVEKITKIPEEKSANIYVIDDFHRLSRELQESLTNLAKLAAEEAGKTPLPKLVLIGINQLGSSLIQLVPDIAKRCGIHSVRPGDKDKISELITAGCTALNIKIANHEIIYEEGSGDYWLTQQLCQTACTLNGILKEVDKFTEIKVDRKAIRQKAVDRLEPAYYPAVKEFCRGTRFRSSNDPYFKLLRSVSEQGSSTVDLTMLANSNQAIRGSINNIKDARLAKLLDAKPTAQRYFYYNEETTQFSIEDPAMFYYVRHLDWDRLRADCGFRENQGKEFLFDIAISF